MDRWKRTKWDEIGNDKVKEDEIDRREDKMRLEKVE